MKIAQFFRNIFLALFQSIKRFPMAILSAIFLSVVAIMKNHTLYSSDIDNDPITRLTLILILGIKLQTCINFLQRIFRSFV